MEQLDIIAFAEEFFILETGQPITFDPENPPFE